MTRSVETLIWARVYTRGQGTVTHLKLDVLDFPKKNFEKPKTPLKTEDAPF